MTLYKNRYRIESARLPGWDYSRKGYYFITLCTKNRDRALGMICKGEMRLSRIGELVRYEWERSFELRSELTCEIYCIMPDHIHAVVVINDDDGVDAINDCAAIGDDGADGDGVGAINDCAAIGDGGADGDGAVETHGRASLQWVPPTNPSDCEKPPMPRRSPRSVSSFVAGFKSSATIAIRSAGHPWNGWQPRFHDHVIRNADELNRIRRYIALNPSRWGLNRHKVLPPTSS